MASQKSPPFWARIQKYLNKPWYIVLVSFLAGLDLAIMLIPTDGLLITAVLVKPNRWFLRALAVSIGSAMGAVVVAYLLQLEGDFFRSFLNFFVEPHHWVEGQAFLEKWGRLSLAVVAFSFFPLAPVVMVAALGGFNPVEIGIGVWSGRVLKYLIFAWLAAKSPQWLSKIWFVRTEIKNVQEASSQATNEPS